MESCLEFDIEYMVHISDVYGAYQKVAVEQALPDFLVTELKGYAGRLYRLMAKDRLLQNTTKACWEHEIQRGVDLSGVKRIR